MRGSLPGGRFAMFAMQEPVCFNCQIAKSQWRENDGIGHLSERHLYCSRQCADDAMKRFQDYGTIDPPPEKALAHAHDGRTALEDGLARDCDVS